jgi:hypothetical protein
VKKKVGRPQKEIKTKRVQCIIPEAVLQELDDKVKLLPKNERDRSKVITSAINEWLKPNRKKRLKNLYLKFFGFRDSSIEKGLFENLNTVVENDSDLDILMIIQQKIILGENPNDDEIDRFNKLLEKQKFYIDKSLKLNCSSNLVRLFTEKLFLNKFYPMKDYAGYCKECGVFFYKEKAKQLFHSPVCKLKYYEKIKKNKHTPQKESLIIANEENVRNKILNEKVNISEILRSINPNKNAIETVKELINGICILSGYKFSIFKELLLNSKGKSDDILRLTIIFQGEYIEELTKRYDISVLKNYTVENFADDMAKEFLPETGRMRIQFKKFVLKSITPNRFNARKNFILGSGYLENKQDRIIALNNGIKYYETTFEREYDLNNDKSLIFEKRNNILMAKTELIQYEEDLDKRIKLDVELLKENRLNLGIYFYLICNYCTKLQEKNEEKYRIKIIYYYKCFRRIKRVLGLLNLNKIQSERRMFKELSTIPIFLQHYAKITTFAAIALVMNKNTEEALEVINQPDVKYISDEDKEMAALAYSMIFSDLKNVDKGIEYLEKLNLQPDLFEKSKAFLLKNS